MTTANIRLPLVLALALVTPACSHATEPAAEGVAKNKPSLFEVPLAQRAHLKITKASRRPVVRPVLAPALVAFDDLKTSEVTPLVSGKIMKVLVREGDRVKVGEPLMEIASPEASENAGNLARDRAALRSKQTILARDEDLYQHKAISLEELQQARLDVDSARTTVQTDEARTSITGSKGGIAVLLSPIEGIVVARKVAVGDAVQAGSTACFTITDPTSIWVATQLYQEDLRRVAIGDTASIRSPLLDTPISGKVIYIGASIDPDTLTIPVRIAAQNAGGLLKQGMYVDAEIMPAKTEITVLVASTAVLRDTDNLPFVYVEAKPGTFARRHVHLGSQLGDTYAITEGIADGETVLTDGALFVQFADSLEQ